MPVPDAMGRMPLQPTIGVYRETAVGEHRVALVPEAVEPTRALGVEVVVETHAGVDAGIPDRRFAEVGARVVTHAEVLDTDILVGVRAPNFGVTHRFRRGQMLIGLLDPLAIALVMRTWADQGLTALSLDLLPGPWHRAEPTSGRAAASAAYARDVLGLLMRVLRDGVPVIDTTDPVLATALVTHGDVIRNAFVLRSINDTTAAAGLP